MISFEEFCILWESLDSPYNYNLSFNKVQENGKSMYVGIQKVSFITSLGKKYTWVADETVFRGSWNIEFYDENERMDITGGGDAFKIFSTIVDITNKFIQNDDNGQIKMLIFSSKEPKRTKLYTNRLKHIKGFELLYEPEDCGKYTQFVLKRTV